MVTYNIKTNPLLGAAKVVNGSLCVGTDLGLI